jgi:hypothetical protein
VSNMQRGHHVRRQILECGDLSPLWIVWSSAFRRPRKPKAPSTLRSAGALQIYPFTNFIATPFMQ